MTREKAEKIRRGIEDKIENNTVDMECWAEFWGFTEDEYDEFLDMAIEALEQVPKWIPASERLPDPNKAVLTYIDNSLTKTYCLAYWNSTKGGWEEWIGYDLLEKDKHYIVLAWMELPEPYEESEK